MPILSVDFADVYEIIGYLGAFLVLASFILKDIKWIRIVNIIGAVFFIIYGISTNTIVNVILNIALIIVHIYYLVKMYLDKKIEQENSDEI